MRDFCSGAYTFTEYGIECLQQIIADERAAGNAPPRVKSTKQTACGPHRMLTYKPLEPPEGPSIWKPRITASFGG
jgi:hypothetical protein